MNSPPRRVVTVDDLRISFPGPGAPREVVAGISLTLDRGETLGIVGESGSGKTMVSMALMALVPAPGQVRARQLQVLGHRIDRLDEPALCRIRGRDIGMVFQHPMTGFNPVRSVGRQIAQSLRRHQGVGAAEARARVVEALADVGIPAPARRYDAYPHEMSGGQLQRAMIAMALINHPSVVVADEPTTALDATVQAQILDLMRRRVRDCGLILVTHDLGVAAQICDRILVVQAGRVVESGRCAEVLRSPGHAYTRTLLDAAPRLGGGRTARVTRLEAHSRPLLEARGMRVSFPVGRERLRAVDDVDIAVRPGETVALVGESGSGKSTTALAMMGVHRLEAGQLHFDGEEVTAAAGPRLRRLRRELQMVLQDPYGSLDPRWTVDRILAEPLVAHRVGDRRSRRQRVRELLAKVQLPEDALDRRPGEFSGGQRQRIAIARALALSPRVLIADEPVSALDVSIQAQIVRLLMDIQADTGVAYLVISHDLALVNEIADRVVVLYLGRVVERGEARSLIEAPAHPYTAALVSAVPVVDGPGGRERIVLGGEPPSPLSPPSGCPFHTRCPIARARCRTERPALVPLEDGREAACFHPHEVALYPAAATPGR